jgi:hypothetical protein
VAEVVTGELAADSNRLGDLRGTDDSVEFDGVEDAGAEVAVLPVSLEELVALDLRARIRGVVPRAVPDLLLADEPAAVEHMEMVADLPQAHTQGACDGPKMVSGEQPQMLEDSCARRMGCRRSD